MSDSLIICSGGNPSMSSVVDRFMRYISIDTQSDEDSPTSPSTAKQFRLARLLAE